MLVIHAIGDALRVLLLSLRAIFSCVRNRERKVNLMRHLRGMLFGRSISNRFGWLMIPSRDLRRKEGINYTTMATVGFFPVLNFVPFLIVMLMSIASPSLGQSGKLPQQVFGKNLWECSSKLKQQIGGWCEIRVVGEHPSISSVWPTNLNRNTRTVAGLKSVLTNWNGAAFDEKKRILYFMGGGRTDDGGNEVYQFGLDDGKWRRLTQPSSLNDQYLVGNQNTLREKNYCWEQEAIKGPHISHTYDGIQFSRVTNTLFVIITRAPAESCFLDSEEGYAQIPNLIIPQRETTAIFEFNPSPIDERNKLGPLKWRRLHSLPQFTYPRMAELPDGAMLIGGRRTLFEFDPLSGEVGKQVLREANYGDALARYHSNGSLLLVSRDVLRIRNLSTGKTKEISMPQRHGKSLAWADDGIIVSWDGRNQILTLDPAQDLRQWTLYDWGKTGPQSGDVGRVYSKWQYVEEEDVFVGLSSHETGVWVYRHPKDLKGATFSKVSLQKLIRQAKAGAIVTLPAGLYGRGLVIDKSLTVRMAGVSLVGVARNRAIISVVCHNCDVTIEDFYARARKASCISGNCAAIKAEGINFRLTVRRAQIDNPVMGILTDNRGGILRIEDSVIQNTGLNDDTRTLAHGVYAGQIDEVYIKNTTIRNVNGKGHIFKSRARISTLENVKLLGEKGFHSRTIDLPCGGTLVLKNSILQHGANTDNSDLISVGTEPKNCKSINTANVSITDNTIVFDRDHSFDERAKNYGPNVLFNWRAPLGKLEVHGNKIVNMEQWSYRGNAMNIAIPDQSPENIICKTRGACGI